MMPSIIDIRFTHRFAEAEKLRDAGYEPIEYAFGQRLGHGYCQMDHHGIESHREGVAIRASRSLQGEERSSFCGDGFPDADAV